MINKQRLAEEIWKLSADPGESNNPDSIEWLKRAKEKLDMILCILKDPDNDLAGSEVFTIFAKLAAKDVANEIAERKERLLGQPTGYVAAKESD